MDINANQALFSLLGTTYGGDGRITFGLPYLGGLAPIGAGGYPHDYKQGEVIRPHEVALSDGDQGPEASASMPGFMALNWCIAVEGIYPSRP